MTLTLRDATFCSSTILWNSYTVHPLTDFQTDLFLPLFLLLQPPLLLLFLPLGLGCLLFPARRTLDVNSAHGLEDAGLVAQPQLVEAAVQILQSLRRKLVFIFYLLKKGGQCRSDALKIVTYAEFRY